MVARVICNYVIIIKMDRIYLVHSWDVFQDIMVYGFCEAFTAVNCSVRDRRNFGDIGFMSF